jgi:hypothetical protein
LEVNTTAPRSSAEYRRMFGVPPSRDALALREAALPTSI